MLGGEGPQDVLDAPNPPLQLAALPPKPLPGLGDGTGRVAVSLLDTDAKSNYIATALRHIREFRCELGQAGLPPAVVPEVMLYSGDERRV